MIPMKKHSLGNRLNDQSETGYTCKVWIRYGPNDSNSLMLPYRSYRTGNVKNDSMIKNTHPKTNSKFAPENKPKCPPKGSWILNPTINFQLQAVSFRVSVVFP